MPVYKSEEKRTLIEKTADEQGLDVNQTIAKVLELAAASAVKANEEWVAEAAPGDGRTLDSRTLDSQVVTRVKTGEDTAEIVSVQVIICTVPGPLNAVRAAISLIKNGEDFDEVVEQIFGE